MRFVVDTSSIVAVIVGESKKAKLILPEQPKKKSPFDVRSIKLSITKDDILAAIQEGHARF